MFRKTPSVVALVAAACVGVAAWLSLGALVVAGAEPTAPRLGLLPPVWWLGASVVAATSVACAIGLTTPQALPLFGVALVVLPWLPPTVPSAFLIWTGPLVGWVWIATFVAWATVSNLDARRVLNRRWLTDPARAPLAAALIALVAYGVAAGRISPLLPLGDEPHYLIIAQSLLKDGDLRIENNHRRLDYASYFGGELKPDYLRRGRDGQIYSVHAPGLPALIAPAFALAGHAGVMGFLALVTALGTALVWKAAYAVTHRVDAAWFGWASVALSAPFTFHAFTVYPDGLGAVLIMTGVVALVESEPFRSSGAGSSSSAERHPMGRPIHAELPISRLVLHGAALSLLPWLHTRYAAAAGLLGVLVLLRIARGGGALQRVAAFLASPCLSAAAWLGFFYAVYGTINPSAPYGGYTQTAWHHIQVGLPGLLFDQQFGLVANAPVYAVALIGLVPLARVRRRLALEVLVLFVSYLLVVGAYRMWWGGVSAPARLAVPALLPLGISAAAAWAGARRPSTRAMAMAALVVSLLMTAAFAAVGEGVLLFNARDGYALWLEWVSPLTNLAGGLPSFHRETVGPALARTAIWAAALAGAWLLVRVTDRHGAAGRGHVALATMGGLAAGVMVALSWSWRVGEVPTLAPAPAQMQFLRGYDSRIRPLGIAYSPFRLVPPEEIVPQIRVAPIERVLPRDPPLLYLPHVPAGVYRLQSHPPRASEGTVKVFIGRADLPIEEWTFAGSPRGSMSETVRLPFNIHSLVVRGDAAARRAIQQVTLQPIAVVPRSQRLSGDYARRGARYAAATVYFLDDRVHEEPGGFWVPGGRSTRLGIAPDARGTRVRLAIRNGPVPNRLTVETGRWRDQRALNPGEEQVMDVPLGVGEAATLLRLRAEHGFRPADVDPASRDIRMLGCWIEVR